MINKLILVTALICFTLPTALFAQKKKKKDDAVELKNMNDSIGYALGVSIGKNLSVQGMDSVNIDALEAGMRDYLVNKNPKINPEFANTYLNSCFSGLQARKGEEKKIKGKAFLDENKNKAGVKVTESGLQYIVLKEGTGPKPGLTDNVKTHYHGTLIDGTVFDSSVDRKEPVTFPVNAVIKGWTEALQMMPIGSKWKLFIPSDLAYGEQGAGGVIQPNETLIFEVELLEIVNEAK